MGRISNSAAMVSAVEALAARQDGVVSRHQMRQLGLSDDRIDSWGRRGRTYRVFRGVYALGHTRLDRRGRIRAAALACGPGAVVSHRSAAYLLGIGEQSPAVVDVTVRGQRGRKIQGIRFHETPYPSSDDRVLARGIPCTSIARTVVDLAGTYGEVGVRKTVEMAATAGVLDLAAIDAVLATTSGRRGVPCLRRVLEDWRPVAEVAKHATVRSLFEARLLPLVAAAGLPIPEINAPIRTADRILEVDLLWPAERFVVEADSRRFHATEVAFERDHRRDRELKAARYGVLRVTWREAEREPEAVLAVIRDELERRRPS